MPSRAKNPPVSAVYPASSATTVPVALTVAGSDCSSGAGLQADLKTFTAHGVYGLTAVTCLVAELPGKVTRIQQAEPEIIAEQIRLLLEGFPIAAMKTGMLYSREIIHLVAGALSQLPPARRPRLVVDPVMVATSGDPLLLPDAVAAYEELLFPMADVITPNMDEAAVLLGRKIRNEAELRTAAEVLRSKYGCAVLVKGGHLRGATAVDVLRDADGFAEYSAPFVKGVSTHGTGCTYSAAIAAGMACGRPLREAVESAKHFVTASIARSFRWGRGAGRIDALNHFSNGYPVSGT